MKYSYLILIIISFAFLLLIHSEVLSQNTIITCSDVDMSCNPVKVKDTFNTKEKLITAFIEFKDLPGGKEIRFLWIDPDGNLYRESMDGIAYLERDKVYPSLKSWNSIILRKKKASYLPGKWKVQVFLGTDLAGEKEFVIEKSENPTQEGSLAKPVGPVFTQSDIIGKVMDFHTGKPLKQARLEIDNISVVSNEHGYYHISAVKPGQNVLSIAAQGYYPIIYNFNLEINSMKFVNFSCIKKSESLFPVTAEVYVPPTLTSSIYHLYPVLNKSLMTCLVTNHSRGVKQVILSTKIEDYSVTSTDTLFIPPETTYMIEENPPFLPGTIDKLDEAYTGLINTRIASIEGGKEILISDKTYNITLLAKDTLIFREKNTVTGAPDLFFNHIAAWLTTHISSIDNLLRKVATNHPQQKLLGYQLKEKESNIEILASGPREQAKAIYDTLQKDLNILYTNSSTSFAVDDMMTQLMDGPVTQSQRSRLPEDVIESKSANCLEGTVLFATLLEAAHLNPVIVIVSGGHSFPGWEKWDQTGEYEFVKTTDLGKGYTFEEAMKDGLADYEKAKPLIIVGAAAFYDIQSLRNKKLLPMK
jgi:hypothetical protein